MALWAASLGGCGDDTAPPDGGDVVDLHRDGGRGDVDLGEEPRVEIGTGTTSFVDISDGDDVELVKGPQGGWHIDVTLRFYYVNPQGLDMRIEGHEVSSTDAIGVPIQRVLTERRVLREGDHWLRVGERLVLTITDESMVVGSDVRIDVTITTAGGTTGSASKVVHVVDETL